MAYETLNEKWHSYQASNNYSDVLLSVQRVVIETDLFNRYVYTIHCDGTGNKIDGEWTWTRNGVQQYELDDNGNPTAVIDIERFLILDTILKVFFENVDVITLQPIEVPIKVSMR